MIEDQMLESVLCLRRAMGAPLEDSCRLSLAANLMIVSLSNEPVWDPSEGNRMITFTRFVLFALTLFVAVGQNGAGQDIRFPNNGAFVRLRMEIQANGPYIGVKANGRGAICV